MNTDLRVILAVLFIFAVNVSICAQTSDRPVVSISGPISNSPIPLPDTGDGDPYRLSSGDNEFGFWGGFSPSATTIFGGLHEDEAGNRKFVIAAFRYGRTLAANDSLGLQYMVDAIPLAVATGTIVGRTTIGGVTTFQRETACGVGLTPAALQLDFANGSKVHPFAHVNVIYAGFSVFK